MHYIRYGVTHEGSEIVLLTTFSYCLILSEFSALYIHMNNSAMINQYATPTEMSLFSKTKPLNFPLVITYNFIYVKDFGV